MAAAIDPIIALHARLQAHHAGHEAAAEAGAGAEEAWSDGQAAIEVEAAAARPTTAAGASIALRWASDEYSQALGGEALAGDLVLALLAGVDGFLQSMPAQAVDEAVELGTSPGARAPARRSAIKAATRRWRRRLARWGRAVRLVPPRPRPERLDLLFGLSAIAAFMRLSKGQVRGLIRSQAIPAFELGGVACARQSSIVRRLEALERAGSRGS